MNHDPMSIKASSPTASRAASFTSLTSLVAKTGANVARLSPSVKILLEDIAHRAHGPDGATGVARHGADVRLNTEDRDTGQLFHVAIYRL